MAHRQDGPAPTQPMSRVVAASLSGALLEWYDVNLYGITAALVFSRLFFPDIDPVLGTLAALATFGVGFVSRPIGALLFGHFGDRIGGKQARPATSTPPNSRSDPPAPVREASGQ